MLNNIKMITNVVLLTLMTLSKNQFTDADCDSSGTDATQFLTGQSLRVALYSGELADCDFSNYGDQCNIYGVTTQAENDGSVVWSGYDIDLLDKLALLGNFSYEIVSMGAATNISQGAGYTAIAQQMLGVLPAPVAGFSPVQIIGQGTWRVNADRAVWAIWSVPVISEDVWLLTKGPELVPDSTLEKVLLVFSPYEVAVWACLFATLVLFSIIFTVSAQQWKGTQYEMTYCGIFYHMAVNCTGREAIDISRAHLKGISMGWVFFIFIIAEVYVANLTAILSKPQSYAVKFNNIDEIILAKATFCVQKNAANDAYFSENAKWAEKLAFSLTNDTRKASITEQIDGVVDGSCDSAEVTREDFARWQQSQPISRKCIPTLSETTLTRRSRGMMSTANNTCTMAAINTLYELLTVQQCSGVESLLLCDADDFHNKHFSVAQCNDDLSSEFSIASLDGIDLLGAYFILFAFTLFGAMASMVGSCNRWVNIPGLSLLMESEGATTARELLKQQEQQNTKKIFEFIQIHDETPDGDSNRIRSLSKRRIAKDVLSKYVTSMKIDMVFKEAKVEDGIGDVAVDVDVEDDTSEISTQPLPQMTRQITQQTPTQQMTKQITRTDDGDADQERPRETERERDHTTSNHSYDSHNDDEKNKAPEYEIVPSFRPASE